jgi:hypothetical protein
MNIPAVIPGISVSEFHAAREAINQGAARAKPAADALAERLAAVDHVRDLFGDEPSQATMADAAQLAKVGDAHAEAEQAAVLSLRALLGAMAREPDFVRRYQALSEGSKAATALEENTKTSDFVNGKLLAAAMGELNALDALNVGEARKLLVALRTLKQAGYEDLLRDPEVTSATKRLEEFIEDAPIVRDFKGVLSGNEGMLALFRTVAWFNLPRLVCDGGFSLETFLRYASRELATFEGTDGTEPKWLQRIDLMNSLEDELSVEQRQTLSRNVHQLAEALKSYPDGAIDWAGRAQRLTRNAGILGQVLTAVEVLSRHLLEPGVMILRPHE